MATGIATYDLTGRMSTLTKGGVTTTYSYDSRGWRIRKSSNTGAAGTLVFYYDQQGHLLGEYDAAGTAIREYVWLGDTPVAMFTPDPVNAGNPSGNQSIKTLGLSNIAIHAVKVHYNSWVFGPAQSGTVRVEA